jgi:hypothetical protein
VAKKKDGVNKSEAIRQLLKTNPEIKAKEIVSTLAGKGIPVSEGLVHFVKGQIKGRKDQKKKVEKAVPKVAATTGKDDPLVTVMKIKHLASELGGLKKLKALVDAMSE